MIKIVDGNPVEVSQQEFLAAKRGILMRANPSDEALASLGFYSVGEGSPQAGQVHDGYVQQNGGWVKNWRDKTTQEIRAERDSLRVSRTQGLHALANAGIWESTILAVIDAYTEPQRTKARAYYANDTWRRSSPLIAQLGTALNLTESQIDDLFIAAAAIEV